jgi:hypothetical protein
MRLWFWSSTVLAVLAVGALSTPVAAGRFGEEDTSAPYEVSTFFDVEFEQPHSWNCFNRLNCLTCENTTTSDSNIIVTHTPDAHKDTHAVAPGAEVRICGNVVFTPHHD